MNHCPQRIERCWLALVAMLAGSFIVCCGCSRDTDPDALVLSQTPDAEVPVRQPADSLDLRFPPGSRVVLSAPPYERELRVLSKGLFAAGEPVVSCDGRRVVFAGKSGPQSEWQIYEAGLPSGEPRALTAQPGGAMEPAFLPHGNVVFVSPVPRPGAASLPALYVTSSGGKPLQLTFTTHAVRWPTVLSDGRILFVSEEPPTTSNTAPRCMLYTINNDGTELTAFAGPLDRVTSVERPRQLADGRVVFITKSDQRLGGAAEFVRMARPFHGCEPLLGDENIRVCSVQPMTGSDLLLCANSSRTASSVWAPFRLAAGGNCLGNAIPNQSCWNTLEAVPAAPSERPMGRLSTMDENRKTGQILCLNANYTRYTVGDRAGAPATRIRVLAQIDGRTRVLGEVPLQADGSFLAEVPADVPLGFDAIDEKGGVLRTAPPMVWVRPGENRSCTGCHAPPHHSPENHRPIAVNFPAPNLGTGNPAVAKK